VPGRMLAIGGHLHQYGVGLRFEDVTSGRVLWQTAPVTDGAGRVIGFPTKKFWWRGGVPLLPDHTYRLTAVYDNPTGHTIPDGAMGTLGGVFLPSDMDAWPPVDRTTAEYQRDVVVTYDTRMADMDDMQGMDRPPTAQPAARGATAATHAGMREGMLNTSIPTRRSAQTP